MHLIKALSTFCVLLSPVTFSLPTESWSPPTSELRTRGISAKRVLDRDIDGLEDRAVLPAIAAIIGIATDIYDLVKDIIEDDTEKASEWVQGALDTLSQSYPEYNILIFHNQDSEGELYNAVHYHYELPLSLGLTKGFEIWVLEYGWFRRAGDGGWQNWGYSGCVVVEDGKYVEFCKKE